MPPFARRKGRGRGVPVFRKRNPAYTPVTSPGQPFTVAPLSGVTIIVEFAWGANPNLDQQTWHWTDETAHVMLNGGIQISQGRADELSTASTATCSFTVDNSTGRFMPYLQTGPNFPNVVRNVPVRVSVDTGTGAGRVVRFQGYATSFTPTWDTTGQAQTLMAITASGALRRLEQGKKPLHSPFTRAISTSAGLQAYWPCEDGTGALTLAEFAGHGSGITVGTKVTTGQGTPPAGSSSLAKLAADGTIASPVSYSATEAWTISFLLNVATDVGSTTTDIMTISLAGATYPTIKIQLVPNYPLLGTGPTATALVGRWLDASGNVQGSDAWLFWYASGFTPYGKWIQVVCELTPYVSFNLGKTTLYLSYVDYEDGQVHAGDSTYSTLYTVGSISKFQVIGSGAMVGSGIGQIAIWNLSAQRSLATLDGTFPFGKAALAYVPELNFGPDSGAIEFSYESATDRLTRLCSEQSVPLTVIGSSNVNMGVQSVATFTDLIRECETADGGLLYDGFGPGLTYLARSSKYAQAAALTLDMAASTPQVSEPFAPMDDDQKNRNDWQISRVNGSSTEYIDESGRLGTGAIGVYDSSATLNVATDDVLLSQASWRVHLGTTEGLRYPSFMLDLVAVPQLANTWLAVDLGNRIDVLNASSVATQHPTGTVSLILEGYSETITPFDWTIQANCSPAEPWRAATIEPTSDASQAWRIDSAGSYLPQDYAAGVTSISVAVSDGYLWSTSASDYPRDVDINGTKVTVTAVAGASSPQTFTITAVTAPLNSGAAVKLWRPVALGL